MILLLGVSLLLRLGLVFARGLGFRLDVLEDFLGMIGEYCECFQFSRICKLFMCMLTITNWSQTSFRVQGWGVSLVIAK